MSNMKEVCQQVFDEYLAKALLELELNYLIYGENTILQTECWEDSEGKLQALRVNVPFENRTKYKLRKEGR